MPCRKQSDILRLASGELSGSDAHGLEQHLAACPSCKQTFDDARAAWNVLAQWQLDTPRVDLTDGVRDRITAAGAHSQKSWPYARHIGPWRVAASIVLSIGLGIAAGSQINLRSERGTALENTDAIVESLGLDAWSYDSATGLAMGFDESDLVEGGAP